MSNAGEQPKPPEELRPSSPFATARGWIGLALCLLFNPCCCASPWGGRVSVDAWEMRAYERTARGIIGAIALGLGIHAIRFGRNPWAGAIAIIIGALMVLWAFVSLTALDNLKVAGPFG